MAYYLKIVTINYHSTSRFGLNLRPRFPIISSALTTSQISGTYLYRMYAILYAIFNVQLFNYNRMSFDQLKCYIFTLAPAEFEIFM